MSETPNSLADSYVACGPSPTPGIKGGFEVSMPSRRTFCIALCVVAAIVLLAAWWGRRQQSLVTQLADKGWMLYTKPGCSYCTAQYAELGIYDGTYPKQVVCGDAPEPVVLGPGGTRTIPVNPTLKQTLGPVPCRAVPGFPFWVNAKTGDQRTGLQRQSALKAMANS